MKRYSLSELTSLPTLAVGQMDDLKIETSTLRIWLSRCSRADGETYDNKVTVERFVIPGFRSHNRYSESGTWEITETYQAI